MAPEPKLPTCWQCLYCQKTFSNPETSYRHVLEAKHDFDSLNKERKTYFYGYQGPALPSKDNTIK